MKKYKIIQFVIIILFILVGFFAYKFLIEKKSINIWNVASTINFWNITFDIIKIKSQNTNSITFYYKDKNNQRFGTIENLQNQLKNKNKKLIFATNGGIFSQTYSPLGLYIENGKKIVEVNKKNGDWNFYLKPNGIFLIQQNKGKVIETSKYQDSSNILFAIQSGPLLVINNEINQLFDKNSDNRYIRSWVWITQNWDIIFAISDEPVTFYEFALFFKEKLNCANALYLDGAISEMYIPKYRENTKENFAVIIGAVVAK